MKSKKLKTLAVAVLLSLTFGAIPPAAETEVPMIMTTVEAAAKKVSLKVSNKKVYAGKTVKINAKATSGAKLSYKTSNKKIAMVNSKGVITGKSAGTAKKSKYKTVKKTITVKVSKQNQSIAAVNQNMTVGQSKNLGVKAKTGLTYKSSNTKIVTVDKKGNMKALKAGSVKITISAKTSGIYNKASKTIIIKVVNKAPVKPVTSTKKPEASKPTATPEPTAIPIPTAVPTETPKQEVSYVTALYIDKTTDDTLYVGEPKECNVKWESTGNTARKDFIYESSDTSIAAIDENGTIIPLKAGKVTITVTSKTPFASSKGADCLRVSKRYTVKVQYNDEYEDGVGFKDPENVVEKGRNVGIGETINPNFGISKYAPEKAEKYLTFSSSDPSVATIDKYGNITGVSKGYVTFSVKTKLPVEETGTYYKEDSVIYHVGDYTYEEILNGLTVDEVASKTAFNVLNELRQDKTKRPVISQDFPEVPARTWSVSGYQQAVTRGARDVMCEILGGWTTEEKSTINALASHGYSQNGYGGAGWEGVGENLGEAATEFFYDRPHAGNQTRKDEIYGAVAVVQYKNVAGINLTSMIVDMSGYSYEEERKNVEEYNRHNGTNETWLSSAISSVLVPVNQYYDICKHFGLTYGMEDDNVSIQVTNNFSSKVTDLEPDVADGSADTTDNTDSAESEDAEHQEETENVEEFEISPEEEINVDAAADADGSFE